MKRVLKNKRGVAMESAILFMFVVLMLGLMLTTVISQSHLQVKVNDTLLKREIAIEQIGHDFVTMNETAFADSVKDSNYKITTEYSDIKTLTVATTGGTHLLTVTVNAEGNVTKWCYTTE